MRMEDKIKCENCSAEYEVKHDLPKDDFTIRYCPFCRQEREVEEDDILNEVEDRYEDWN